MNTMNSLKPKPQQPQYQQQYQYSQYQKPTFTKQNSYQYPSQQQQQFNFNQHRFFDFQNFDPFEIFRDFFRDDPFVMRDLGFNQQNYTSRNNNILQQNNRGFSDFNDDFFKPQSFDNLNMTNVTKTIQTTVENRRNGRQVQVKKITTRNQDGTLSVREEINEVRPSRQLQHRNTYF